MFFGGVRGAAASPTNGPKKSRMRPSTIMAAYPRYLRVSESEWGTIDSSNRTTKRGTECVRKCDKANTQRLIRGQSNGIVIIECFLSAMKGVEKRVEGCTWNVISGCMDGEAKSLRG